MQLLRYSAGLGVILLAAATAGCSSAKLQAARDKVEMQSPVAVKAVVAQAETLRRTTTQPATVHAYYSADIYAKVSGYVRETSVDIGDRVKKGDVLAVIDVPEMEKQLLVTEARVTRYAAQETRAEAGKRLAEAKLASARAGIAEAESRIASAEAKLQASEAEFNRTEALVQQQSVQQKLLDEARQRRDSNRANVESANAAVTMAESQVNVAEAAIAAAEAEVRAANAETKVAEAEHDELQVMLDYAELRAPFDGVVTHRGIDPGDLVRTASDAHDSADPHFIIAQIDRLRIRTTVPEIDSPLVDIGDAVSIDLTSARLPTMEGKVTRTSRSLDPSTRTMTVEIELPNTDGKLLPGMYGEATVVLVEKPNVVMLPASAVRFGATGNSFVYTIGDGDVVNVVDVTLGYDTGERIEITSSLSAGQRVIDAHLKRFGDGDLVRVVD